MAGSGDALRGMMPVSDCNKKSMTVHSGTDSPVQGAGGTPATLECDALECDVVECDVLVIGGGPAGSTTAITLAKRGWKVVQLEKGHHPRFHIGESLLPMNLPILQRLGVLDRVAGIGVYKPGADFPLVNDDGSVRVQYFSFERALNPVFGHAYQVKRAEFDDLLFRAARENGVDNREGVTVEEIQYGTDGRPTGARARTETGETLQVRMRYLVDATGRDTFLGSRLKVKVKNPKHQSAALFSHFKGVERREGEQAGNITVERFSDGWIWMIPLRDDVMSIGAVCSPEYLKKKRGDSEAFLRATLDSVPTVKSRLSNAERVAPVHATGNYSYTCSRMCGPGWTMVGDAFAFIDPIFSSGVYLGMNSGECAAGMIDGALRDPSREAALQRAMTRRLRRGLKEFSWFIYRFTSPVMRHLFAHPSNRLQLEQAVVSMLAGDVFDNPAVHRRLRVFRMVYALNALAMAPTTLRAWWRRRQGRRAGFHGDTLQAES
jgi:flavin-dependent dehydrogenase